MQLGGFSEDYLNTYQIFLNGCAELLGDTEGVYDFARCVRPDGSTYGTRGKCIPPNKPAALESAKEPETEKVDRIPAHRKMDVSMGGYKVSINVNTKKVR